MEYLAKYNLSKEDINDIKNSIDDMDFIEYELHERNMCKILDYLKSKQFDIKPLLLYKSFMFYTDAEILIDKLKNIPEENIPIINADIDLIEDYL